MLLDLEGEEQASVSEASLEKRRKAVIEDDYVHKIQRRHFLLFDILPLLGTAAALALLAFHPIGWTEIGLFLAMWLFTGFGISVGHHRLFSHRAFTVPKWFAAVFAVAGAMAGQGALISWVAIHRRHHEFSDRDGDPHSPNLEGGGLDGRLRGLAHAHFLWMAAHAYPNVVHYVPDLLREDSLVSISRHYYRWVLAGLAIPALVGGVLTGSWMGVLTGFLWGGAVRMFVLEHSMWSVNSLCHVFGSRPFKVRDNSRNIGLLAPLVFGETWHQNHHAFPSSASFGLAWYGVDPGYWLVRLLGALGLARDIKVPTKEQMRRRSAAPATTA